MINKELQEETNKELMVLATMLGFEVNKSKKGTYTVSNDNNYILRVTNTYIDTEWLISSHVLNLPSTNAYMHDRKQRYNFVKDYLFLARKRINEPE